MPLSSHRSRDIWVLTGCQGLFILSMSIDLTLTGLVGYQLAADKRLATLPFALITVATAVTAIISPFLLRRLGRRRGFALGALTGGAGGLVSVFAVMGQDFWLFCLGTTLVGVARAFAQYYRLAAADLAPVAAKGKAISTVLAGGVVAALIGPALADWSKGWLGGVTFAGSYLVVSVLGLLATLLLLVMYRDEPGISEERVSPNNRPELPARRLGAVLSQPVFVAALANSLVGYAVMMLVMTATPIAVVLHHYTIDQGAQVIQWHLLGMYVPSLFAGYLIRRLGVGLLLLLGNLLCAACVLIAVQGSGLGSFYAALLCLGVGWNFMFAGGSTLLSLSYRPAERAKTQAASEFTTYAGTAIASLLAGPCISAWGWTDLNLAVLPVLAASILATLWWMWAQRQGEQSLVVQKS